MPHLHALPSFSCKAFGAVLCFLPKLNRKYSMPACLTGSCLFPPLGPLVGFGLGFFLDLLGSSLDYGVEVHTTFSGSGCWASGCWVCGACLRLCSGIGLQLRRGMQKPLLPRTRCTCVHPCRGKRFSLLGVERLTGISQAGLQLFLQQHCPRVPKATTSVVFGVSPCTQDPAWLLLLGPTKHWHQP